MSDDNKTLILEVADFDAALDHYTTTVGFRIDRISPADSPREVDLSGHGLAIQIRRESQGATGNQELSLEDIRDLFAGGRADGVRLGAAHSHSLDIPPIQQSLVISRVADSEDFAAGRAGMGYRDLIPNRQGGRFIASHIRIAGGGDVPDYAHFHKIRFQMIYCFKGWVRVVYEDQGDPMVLNAGDCVLQPPEIRHRVLESSPGLEVIEIGCPAEHDTYADHEIHLPTATVDRNRNFSGQGFVWHVAADANWSPWRLDGFECRDIGIADATDGLAGVHVLRPAGVRAPQSAPQVSHAGEFLFFFVLDGSATFRIGGAGHHLVSGDSVVIPAGAIHGFDLSPDAEMLEVALPADLLVEESARPA